MNQQKEPNTVVQIRIPDPWIAVMGEKADQLQAENGIRFSRADIIRMALARYLGLVQPAPDGDADSDQAQAAG